MIWNRTMISRWDANDNSILSVWILYISFKLWIFLYFELCWCGMKSRMVCIRQDTRTNPSGVDKGSGYRF